MKKSHDETLADLRRAAYAAAADHDHDVKTDPEYAAAAEKLMGPTTAPEAKVEATKAAALEELIRLGEAGFIGIAQRQALRAGFGGEERQFFYNMVVDLAAYIAAMPKTYEQDGAGDAAVVHLHYFVGGCDWYITEKDSEAEQLQAFGWADLGYGGELGYIWLAEITAAGAELDLYWTPRPLADIKAKREEGKFSEK